MGFALIGSVGAMFCSPCDEARGGNGKTRKASITWGGEGCDPEKPWVSRGVRYSKLKRVYGSAGGLLLSACCSNSLSYH